MPIIEGLARKRAKGDEWPRDWMGRIQDKAEPLVRKEAARTEERAERQVADANAQAVAGVRLAHRRDIQRARGIANALLDELERQADPCTLQSLQMLGELLRAPQDSGPDKLNDLYRKVLDLPERSKTMKTLVEILRIVVEMERQAFGMGRESGPGGEGGVGHFELHFVDAPLRDNDPAGA